MIVKLGSGEVGLADDCESDGRDSRTALGREIGKLAGIEARHLKDEIRPCSAVRARRREGRLLDHTADVAHDGIIVTRNSPRDCRLFHSEETWDRLPS